MENKPKINLFDLNNEFLQASKYLEECKIDNVEPEKDMLEMYFEFLKLLVQKVDGCYEYYNGIDYDILKYKDEIKKLQRKIKILQNSQDRFADYLINIASQNNNTLKGDIHKLKVQSRASVLLLDEEIIPPEYIAIKTERVISKSKIAEDLKKNILIEGATLQYNKYVKWD